MPVDPALLTIVFMKWFDPAGRYNANLIYGADHVNRARRMVDRHLSIPHRFVLVTDDSTGVDPDIAIVPIRPALLKVGHRWPKLMLFAPEARRLFGERVLYLDLDMVIVDDITPLVTEEPFRIARALTRRMPYNSSMMLLRPGVMQDVWKAFQLRDAHALVKENGIGASDQYLIYKVIGPGAPTWSEDDGVQMYTDRWPESATPPQNARIVFFPGPHDPSMRATQERQRWIADHWH